MDYCMNLGGWNQVFAVPCQVVDQHLRLAGAVQLKVLLWLLRHAGEDCSSARISSELNMEEMDIRDAMQYWVEAGLILKNDGELTPIPKKESKETAGQEEVQEPDMSKLEKKEAKALPEEETKQETLQKKIQPRQKNINSADIARRIQASEEIHSMLDMAEYIFKRPLSTPELGRIIDLHDWYGLPADVVVMIIQYAASADKANMNYIEKMAQDWAEHGIVTHRAAEEKIAELDQRQNAWKKISNMFGITGRLPSSYECECAIRWIDQWKFSDDLLREAYNRCVDSTGKLQFKYMNGILERWNKEGFFTLADVQRDAAQQRKKSGNHAIGETGKNASTPKKETSYDIENFEKNMMNDLF